MFAGGGTAGHLFPGLAVARHLTAQVPDLQITFAGSGRAFERREVEAAGMDYLPLRCRPLPRRFRDVIPFLADNWAGLWAADRFLRTHRVRIVVGLGGYASVLMARAAIRRRVPLVLLEQNVVPGRATRYLARAATLICTSFPETARFLTGVRCPVCVTGNPIRPGLARCAAMHDTAPRSILSCNQHSKAQGLQPLGFKRPQRQLVILGGSGGAQTLNETMPRVLDRLRSVLPGWRIVHQAGDRSFQRTRELYRMFRIEATVVPFISETPGASGQTGMSSLLGQTGMSGLLAESDLAVCRAGGTTLAELAAAAVPAILLPYPHAADDHQRKNAEVFAAAGGCLMIDQRECPDSLDRRLADAIGGLAADPAKRTAMAAAVHRLARPNAARDVAERILEIAGRVPLPRGKQWHTIGGSVDKSAA